MNDQSYTRKPIDEAIAILGSQTKLAAAVGVSQPAITKARAVGRVSAALAVKIEAATKGRVPCWRMRPDLWAPPEQSA